MCPMLVRWMAWGCEQELVWVMGVVGAVACVEVRERVQSWDQLYKQKLVRMWGQRWEQELA